MVFIYSIYILLLTLLLILRGRKPCLNNVALQVRLLNIIGRYSHIIKDLRSGNLICGDLVENLQALFR